MFYTNTNVHFITKCLNPKFVYDYLWKKVQLKSIEDFDKKNVLRIV